jgi:hypothetical protein
MSKQSSGPTLKQQIRKAAEESAALLSSQDRKVRSKVLDTLKLFALSGSETFELYVTETETLLAEAANHPQAGRISLSRMQKEKVPGVSTFYTYVIKLRQFIDTGNVDAIQSATTSSLVKAAPPTRRESVRRALLDIRSYHQQGHLLEIDYNILATIVNNRYQ